MALSLSPGEIHRDIGKTILEGITTSWRVRIFPEVSGQQLPRGHLPVHGVPSPNLSDLPIFQPLSFFSFPLIIPTTPHRASVRESPADGASLIFLWLRRSDAHREHSVNQMFWDG